MIGNGAGLNAGITEQRFAEGKSFSYEDYLIFGASEKKTVVFDATECTCGSVEFESIVFSATSGPVLIDYFAGVTANEDGTVLSQSNRLPSSGIVSQAVLRLNPTGVVLPATKFSGDMVPATGLNPNTSTGSSTTGGLRFELLPGLKYAFTIENLDGAGTYAQIKMTWYET